MTQLGWCARRGELPALPLVSWVTLTGLRERWRRTMGGVKAMYTLARCKKFVPGFSLPAFKADALRLYEEVCQAIAADDKTLLRQVRSCRRPEHHLGY
jgi:large subunit ribosomal protein L45